MNKKLFSLLTLLVTCVSGAWADAVSATQTFTNERAICTWTNLNVSVTRGQTAGDDGLFFTAKSDKDITTSSGTVQGGSGAIAIVYVQVPSASSNGTITMVSSSDADARKMYLASGKYVSCSKTGSTESFVASDVVLYEGNYYIKLTNTDNSDVKIKSFQVNLAGGEVYPASVAVDPEFSLSSTSITTLLTAQINVGTKSGLDGITFDGDVTYSTSGVVTVDANGVVTPVAPGTTTIQFNTNAVAGKYNASTGNSLTITVTEAITVFNAAGLTNYEMELSQTNVETYDYLSSNVSYWADKTSWPQHSGYYLDMKQDRKITLTIKNAVSFELFVSGTVGRKYKIKVGDADAVTYTQSSSSGFVSSGVIATGTTDEVDIVVEGTSDGTLYPVYYVINPAISVPMNSYEWSTLVSDKALDFTGSDVKAYAVTGHTDATLNKSEALTAVPENTPLLLNAPEGNHPVIIIPSASSVGTNMLKAGDGTNVTPEANKTKYVLSAKSGAAAFKKIATYANVPEGKAYLQFDEEIAAREFFALDEETTGMNVIEKLSNVENKNFYNLNGQRVAQPTKGLYIVNGKKVVIK